ncbi:transposase [Mesorhizobium sp. M0938]
MWWTALGDVDGVLIVDDTAFVKNGDRSAVVARQYSGTAGRIENSRDRRVLGLREPLRPSAGRSSPYVPESWTKDRARCARVSIPETVEFATKPKMASAMVEAALDAGVPCAYVFGDVVYGADSSLRRMREAREQPMSLRSEAITSRAVEGIVGLRKPRPRNWPGSSIRRLGLSCGR